MKKSGEGSSSHLSDDGTTHGANSASEATPASFASFVGQEPIVRTLRPLVTWACDSGTGLGHLVLVGQPGSGKRTLVRVLADELGINMKVTNGSVLGHPGEVAAILTNLHKGDVLLIENLHMLSHACAEVLAQAMESRALDIVIGKGPAARSIRLKLPHFTVIGTTHRPDLLSFAIVGVYPLILRFQPYSCSELEVIVQQEVGRWGVPVDLETIRIIASLANGSPRQASQLLRHWSQLTYSQANVRSPEQVHELLAQIAQEYEDIASSIPQDQESMAVLIEKRVRALEVHLEDRVSELESSMKDRFDLLDAAIEELNEELSKRGRSWLD